MFKNPKITDLEAMPNYNQQRQEKLNKDILSNISSMLQRFTYDLSTIQHFSYDITRNSVMIRVRLFNGNILIKEFLPSGVEINNGIQIPSFNPNNPFQVYGIVNDLRKRGYSQGFIAFLLGYSQSTISRILRNPPKDPGYNTPSFHVHFQNRREF